MTTTHTHLRHHYNPQKDSQFKESSKSRHLLSRTMLVMFQLCTVLGIIILATLLFKIVNDVFGYVALDYEVRPSQITPPGRSLEGMSHEELSAILQAHISKGLFRRLQNDKPMEQRSAEEIYELIIQWVLKPTVINQWDLFSSIFRRNEIVTFVRANHPQAQLVFRSWISYDFLIKPQSSDALNAGVRTAILGSLWTIVISILFAFPIGIGSAIYLEEYAPVNPLTSAIQTNINNLAGVPSIIYGILGLSIFVRLLGNITSGVAFGYADPSTANGRTILSAGLTLGLLVLPLVIINAQEAIRAVPNSLREASYGLGATRWQTIWHHVLPNAISGILTGTILAISRAIGETAPLVVVGASTFITVDPNSPFSKFTTLPIQIYQWTSRPQDEYRHIAAAASIVLIALLLLLNATTIILRNRMAKKMV